MDRIESINTERIRWCANERGIALERLADEAGVPQKALASLFEDGLGLTFAQLRKLADYFGRGVLFFLDPGRRISCALQMKNLTLEKYQRMKFYNCS